MDSWIYNYPHINKSFPSPGRAAILMSEIVQYSNPIQNGLYYLIINVDDLNEISELNEWNNVIFRPIQIGSAEIFNETAAHQTISY